MSNLLHTTRGCMSYEEEDTCMSFEEEDTCMSYEEEDTCMSYEVNTSPTCCINLDSEGPPGPCNAISWGADASRAPWATSISSRVISGHLGRPRNRRGEMPRGDSEAARDGPRWPEMTLRSPEVILGCGRVSGALGDVDFISGHLGPSRAASESSRDRKSVV